MDNRLHLQSLKRGLQVLALLNLRNWVTIADVAKEFQLARTTAQRILTTLEEDGYIVRDCIDKKYTLTPKVKCLADGFDEEDWVVKIANPLIHELTAKISWPLLFAVPCGESMLVRAATDHEAPLAIEKFSVGASNPIMQGPTGHVYLAYCDNSTRSQLISMLSRSKDPRQSLAKSPEFVNQLIRTVRNAGYAIVKFPDPDIDADGLSVPVIVNNRFFGALLLRYIKRSLTDEEIRKQYLPLLQETSAEISKRLSELKTQDPNAFRLMESMDSNALPESIS